jgi:hypothetical protein
MAPSRRTAPAEDREIPGEIIARLAFGDKRALFEHDE